MIDRALGTQHLRRSRLSPPSIAVAISLNVTAQSSPTNYGALKGNLPLGTIVGACPNQSTVAFLLGRTTHLVYFSG